MYIELYIILFSLMDHLSRLNWNYEQILTIVRKTSLNRFLLIVDLDLPYDYINKSTKVVIKLDVVFL